MIKTRIEFKLASAPQRRNGGQLCIIIFNLTYETFETNQATHNVDSVNVFSVAEITVAHKRHDTNITHYYRFPHIHK